MLLLYNSLLGNVCKIILGRNYMARKFDKYGFEILEDEEPLDYTSIDEDDGDLIDNERQWYEEDDYLEEDISMYKEEL